jgi:nicotinamide mononucleotide transporter
MPNIFDIREIFVTVLGYQLSYLELMGTVFGLLCVVLLAREKICGWPIGILNIIFFFILFYQIQLYSDMLLQVYFLGTSIFGWWKWTHPDPEEKKRQKELRVSVNGLKANLIWTGVVLLAVALLGTFMRYVHVLWPSAFSKPAAYPYWDAATTVMSILAQWFLAKKVLESWILWVVVDIICVVLYFKKDVLFMSLEYFIFLIIAAYGLVAWWRAFRTQGRSACAEA